LLKGAGEATATSAATAVMDGLSAAWSAWGAVLAPVSANNAAEETAARDGEQRNAGSAEGWSVAGLGMGVESLREQFESVRKAASEAVAGLDAEKIQRDAQKLMEDASRVMSDPRVDGDDKRLRAPWEALSAEDEQLADAMRDALLKLTVDCVYSKETRSAMFLDGLKDAGVPELEMTPDNERRVRGAVLHDANLSRLYAGLVPRWIKREEVFWGRYFFHVDRIHRGLLSEQLGGGAQVSSTRSNIAAADGDVGAKAVESDADARQATTGVVDHTSRGAERDWDKEIDEIFD